MGRPVKNGTPPDWWIAKHRERGMAEHDVNGLSNSVNLRSEQWQWLRETADRKFHGNVSRVLRAMIDRASRAAGEPERA